MTTYSSIPSISTLYICKICTFILLSKMSYVWQTVWWCSGLMWSDCLPDGTRIDPDRSHPLPPRDQGDFLVTRIPFEVLYTFCVQCNKEVTEDRSWQITSFTTTDQGDSRILLEVLYTFCVQCNQEVSEDRSWQITSFATTDQGDFLVTRIPFEVLYTFCNKGASQRMDPDWLLTLPPHIREILLS